MRSWPVITALFVLSCSGSDSSPTPATPSTPATSAPKGPAPVNTADGNPAPPPVIDGDVFPPCAQYEGMSDTYGYCIYKLAGGFPTRDEMERWCPLSGSWEAECRHSWVAGRQRSDSGFELDDLLDACKGNPDCTFELLDFRPADDVIEQLSRCERYAGRYGPDCVGHAMQRWWLSAPDEDEFNRVSQVHTRYPKKVGYYLGVSVACTGIGQCTGDPDVAAQCEGSVAHLQRKPEHCPSRVKKQLWPNKGKRGATPPSKPGQQAQNTQQPSQPEQQPQNTQQPSQPGQQPQNTQQPNNAQQPNNTQQPAGAWRPAGTPPGEDQRPEPQNDTPKPMGPPPGAPGGPAVPG